MPIQFKISSTNPVAHFAEIEMSIEGIDSEELLIELPSWRPGRYELGNFAKNVRSWQARNLKGDSLAFKKITKDTWQVSTEGSQSIIVKYEYYCAQPDAGGCWIDENQFYINPVHCFMYVADRLHESCTIEVIIPSNYKIAGSLRQISEKILSASDFHELYDSPFLASATLQMRKYVVGEAQFQVWFQGSCLPDWGRITSDFIAFSEEQLKTMGEFPFKEYHFLVQMLPYKFYHGVEHQNSTVLALGPGDELMNKQLYTDFTGVASHELFHAWNIKSIRPHEMLPYNYKKENYSRLGFVYEGVTTYYGDLFLVRSGVYNVEQFFKEIDDRLQKHFDNPGRFNLSVADSSFDTWLDGYTNFVPGRKTSIYNEGCLTAMMTDLLIRKKTNSKRSLDDVMKTLYYDFGKKNIGYTEHDYISIVENVAGQPLADFFLDYVYGTEDDEKLIDNLLSLVGCEIVKKYSNENSERYFGFRVAMENHVTLVAAVMPGSPAFNHGLGKDDEIVAVNEIKVEENLQSLLKMFQDEKIVLTVLTPMKTLKDITLSPSSEDYFPKYSIARKINADRTSKEFFRSWLKQEFEERVGHEA